MKHVMSRPWFFGLTRRCEIRPVWLIEAGVYWVEAEPLRAEIRRQGMAAAFVPHQALKNNSDVLIEGRPLSPGDCVNGYGTYPFARQNLSYLSIHGCQVPADDIAEMKANAPSLRSDR
jgi:hypothetical protein